MPAYGYSPQGVNLNRQFTGTARWVPQLNALRETDPQAYAEIERRADEIWSGYTDNELYSKTMEGGTGQRWEREAKSRAFFQAFEEYKRIPQTVTQTDKPMPIDEAYAPDVERSIQQVMQHQGLTRAQAIAYLAQNAGDPSVRAELSRTVGGGAAPVTGGTYTTLSKAAGDDALSTFPASKLATRTPDFSEGITSATPEDRLIANEYIAEIKKDPTATYPTVGGLTIEEQPNALSIQALVSEYTNSLDYDRSVTSFRGPGQQPTEAEGIDSPTSPIVEQSSQPNLAPGEERVTEDSAPQGDVAPTTMAQLMSGGQEVYGKPATKIGTGEKVAGILQALASAGQSYFGGRDIKAADKRQRQGTARANLMNALAGNMVAQAPRASARPGAVTSALGGLSKAAGEYVRQREAQKALDQQAMLTKLTQPKLGSSTTAERSLGVSFYESGAHAASKWDAERNTDEYVSDVQSFLSENLKRALAQTGSSTLRQGLLAQAQKGFRETLAKIRADKARTDATAGGKAIKATSKFFRSQGETHALKDEPSNFQGVVDQWEQDTGDTLTENQRRDLYAFYHDGRTTGLGRGMTSTMSVNQMFDLAKRGGEVTAGRKGDRSFSSFMREYPSIENFANKVAGGFDVNLLRLEYYGAYDDERADLTALPTWAKKEVAAINASIDKTKLLEEAWIRSDWRGPLMGRLPIFQYFTPDDAQYDALREAFVLDLAAVINAGRPSDKDAEAIGKLIPTRASTEVVAGGIFDTLRQMLLAKKGAIEAEFHLPIWNYVNEEDNSFDVAAYQNAVDNKQLSAEDVTAMAEAMNDPDADIKRVEDLRINFLKAFDAAGVAYTTQEDGLIVVTTAGQVGGEAGQGEEGGGEADNSNLKSRLQQRAEGKIG